MDDSPDYSTMSSPPEGLGIDLDFSSLAPLPTDPTDPTGSAVRGGAPGNHDAPQNGRRGGGGGHPEAADEPLIDAGRDLLCVASYHRAGWPGTSATTWLRRGVVSRLLESVQLDLPDGLGLAIFDGWRSVETIEALYAHYYGPGSTLDPGYLADPSSPSDDPPPHLTGGAVDLTLSWHGTPLSLGTPFDEFTPRAHLAALDGVADGHPDTLARDLRRLLYEVMTEAGFAAYPREWWHFSYGDADWARRHGLPQPLYGPTAPSR